MTLLYGRNLLILLIMLLAPLTLHAEERGEQKESYFFTIWPLIDYRETATGDQSSLSILGPLFRRQHQGDDRETALRPIFSHAAHPRSESSETDVLYPVASRDTSPTLASTQILQLFRSTSEAGEEGTPPRESTMLFPFIISGTSEKYGPYLSLFPLYGDIYERFWRDEYHYVLFPLYSRTVKKGTTSTNILYPFFSFISGENESGFQFWPLYGRAEKKGVYRSAFTLWPFFSKGETGLDTEKPTEYLNVFPLYTSSTSPVRSERHVLWPFFGYTDDQEKKQKTWDLLWPFWVVSRGDEKTVNRFLPLFSQEERKETRKEWYLWPLYRHEATTSPAYERDNHRLLYFLYSSNHERLTEFDVDRRKRAFWPLFLYRSETGGFSRLTMPALVEPIIDREGIERNWAPLWRIYQHTWNDRGDSGLSILWNLFWRERSGDDLAYELFPLVSYRREGEHVDLRFLKGLITYDDRKGRRSLSLFWLPFSLGWGGDAVPASVRQQ